jgi:DNA mismatch repair ATPase MutL
MTTQDFSNSPWNKCGVFLINLDRSPERLASATENFAKVGMPFQRVAGFDASKEDHLILSGLPINVTESQVSSVLEQLISDLSDGIPESSFSQNDSIAKSMAKSLAVKTGAYLTEKEQENLVNVLFACKDPNVSPFQKPTFITMRVEDIDKKFTL